MATFESDDIGKTYSLDNGAVPMLETPTGGMVNAQAGASGGALVELVGTPALPDGAAKQTTLAAILAKLTADPATQTTLAAILALAGTVRLATTPDKADTDTGPAQVDKRGNAHVNAALRCERRVALTSGLATSAASLSEGACDCLRVDTADTIVYAQPPERALLASQSGADWTGAAGWSRVGNVWTHSAGGGAGDLEYTMSGANVGDTYCVIYTLTMTAGTSITEKLGTGAGSARNASGTYVKLITSAGNAKIIFTATDDAAASIDVTTVYVIPGTPPLAANSWEPESAVKVVALAAKATPATADTSTKVWAGWYRRAAAVEVV